MTKAEERKKLAKLERDRRKCDAAFNKALSGFVSAMKQDERERKKYSELFKILEGEK
jgi:hypothetical protein